MRGDHYVLTLKEQLAKLYEIRKVGALLLVAAARDSKEELKFMLAALEEAHKAFDEFMEGKCDRTS